MHTAQILSSNRHDVADHSSQDRKQLTAKLFDARTVMMGVHGDQYRAKLGEYEPYIVFEMRRSKCDVISAAMTIVNSLKSRFAGSEMKQALVMATCVEMLEAEAYEHKYEEALLHG